MSRKVHRRVVLGATVVAIIAASQSFGVGAGPVMLRFCAGDNLYQVSSTLDPHSVQLITTSHDGPFRTFASNSSQTFSINGDTTICELMKNTSAFELWTKTAIPMTGFGQANGAIAVSSPGHVWTSGNRGLWFYDGSCPVGVSGGPEAYALNLYRHHLFASENSKLSIWSITWTATSPAVQEATVIWAQQIRHGATVLPTGLWPLQVVVSHHQGGDNVTMGWYDQATPQDPGYYRSIAVTCSLNDVLNAGTSGTTVINTSFQAEVDHTQMTGLTVLPNGDVLASFTSGKIQNLTHAATLDLLALHIQPAHWLQRMPTQDQ
jgi:hypothetical protein